MKIRGWKFMLVIVGLGMLAGLWIPFDKGDALPGNILSVIT